MKLFSILLFFLFFAISTFCQTTNFPILVKNTGAKMTEEVNKNSKSLITLNRGDSLIFLEIVQSEGQNRYKVEHKGQVGFISSYFIKENEKLSLAELDLKNKIKKNKIKEDSIQKVERQFELERLRDLRESQIQREKDEIRYNDSIADEMLKTAKADSKAFYEQKRKENILALNTRREKFHKKYGEEIGDRIALQKIWIGMSEDMLIDSWGKPNDINQTVTRYSVRKQYVYGLGQYVYVVNGVVEAWQN